MPNLQSRWHITTQKVPVVVPIISFTERYVEVSDGFLPDFCKQMFWMVEAGSSCPTKLFSNAKIIFTCMLTNCQNPECTNRSLCHWPASPGASTPTLWTWMHESHLSTGLGIQSLPDLCCSSPSLHFNHSHTYVLKSTKRTLHYYQVLPRNCFCLHVSFGRMELRGSQGGLGAVLILCCSIHHHPLPLVFYSAAWERNFISLFCLQGADQSERLIKGEYFDLWAFPQHKILLL